MPLIPNLADAAYPDQAGVDSGHFEQLRVAIRRTGVVVGCAVTARSPAAALVDVAGGTIAVEGVNVAVAAQSVTVANGHAAMPRHDLIVVGDDGVAVVIAGGVATQTNLDGSSNAEFAPWADDQVLLAVVYVPALNTAVAANQITDARVFLAGNAFVRVTDPAYGAVGDGQTSAVAAFQAAIDAVFAAGGGVVDVPPGRYVIDGPIEVKSNVTLRGVNADSMGLAMSTGSGVIGRDDMRHSVLLVRDRQGTDTKRDGTFRMQGSNPSLVGLVFYHDQQKAPLQRWIPDWKYNLGARIEPLTDYLALTSPWVGTGRIYEATTVPSGAVTAATPPTFPTTQGATVTESTGVVWTCRGTRAQAATFYGEPGLTTHDVPYAYPATVSISYNAVGAVSRNPKLPVVRNCYFANSYYGIAYDDKHNLLDISDCWIGAYNRGIYVNNSTGIVRISNIHVFPYYANVNGISYLQGAGDTDGGSESNQTSNWHGHWSEINGAGAEFKDALWTMLDRFFVYGSGRGLYLTPATDGKASNGSGTHCKFDHVGVGIDAEETNSAGWVFYGTHVHSNSVRVYTSRFSVATRALATTADSIDLTFIGGFFNCGEGVRDVTHQGGNLTLDGVVLGGVPHFVDSTDHGENIRVFGEGTGPDGKLILTRCRVTTGNASIPFVSFNTGARTRGVIAMNDIGARNRTLAIEGTVPTGVQIEPNNPGLSGRKGGAATALASGALIAHGLGFTPVRALATCATPGVAVSVDLLTSTNIRVRLYDVVLNAVATGTHTVYWSAEG